MITLVCVRVLHVIVIVLVPHFMLNIEKPVRHLLICQIKFVTSVYSLILVNTLRICGNLYNLSLCWTLLRHTLFCKIFSMVPTA